MCLCFSCPYTLDIVLRFTCNFLNYIKWHYYYSHSLWSTLFHPFTFSSFSCSTMDCGTSSVCLILHWFAALVLLATHFQWHSPAFGAKCGGKVATNLLKPNKFVLNQVLSVTRAHFFASTCPCRAVEFDNSVNNPLPCFYLILSLTMFYIMLTASCSLVLLPLYSG